MKGIKSRWLTLCAIALGATLAGSVPVSAIEIESADSKDELTVFRPSEGNWYISASAAAVGTRFQWGLPGDYPVAGPYRSTTDDELAVWRPTDGVWYLRFKTGDFTFATAAAYQWGLPGDLPAPCDFNADSLNELTVFRPSSGTWYTRASTTSSSTSYSSATSVVWGLSGDTPIPEDYDDDGKCDYTVFRNGTWYVILSSQSTATSAVVAWGASGDIPVPGHYDSDGIIDFAIYRETASSGPVWVIRKSSSTQGDLINSYITRQWGLVGDQPVPADYDGDGLTDMAVWRPSNGSWYVLTSSSSYASATSNQWGLTGDISYGFRRGTNPS